MVTNEILKCCFELGSHVDNIFDIPEDAKISFKVDKETVYSKYDDPRDPTSYKLVVKKITLKHEKKL